MHSRWRPYHALVLGVLCVSGAAVAGENYEERLIEWGLERVGRPRAVNPQGRRIEAVFIESENIVAPTDPWPQLINKVHMRTRPSVVRAELLLHEGDTYDATLAAETERNLRRLFILALARVVAVEGENGGVALLVVTKDLWSIRFNTEYLLVGTLLEYFRWRPSEQNLLGLNLRTSISFELELATLGVGEGFSAYRFFGLPVSVTQSAQVLFNRKTSQPEGSSGSLVIERPLYRLADVWSYQVAGSWRNETSRVFRGAAIWQLPFTDATGATEAVPYVYQTRRASGGAQLTRSFGSRFKTNVSLGFAGHSRRYALPTTTVVTPEQSQWFKNLFLPRSEQATYLSAAVQAFEAKYRVLRNVEAFARSEDFQAGYSAVFVAHWADPVVLSPLRFTEAGAAVRYRWISGDNVLQATVAGTLRYEPDLQGPFVNKRRAAELLKISPFIGIGRVIARALWDVKDADLQRAPLFLGSETGLRGAGAQAMTGTRVALFNLEYRSRPFELGTLHLGGVLFYDVGSAYVTQPKWVHSVGLGLRIMVPQFDILPVRLDIGYVVSGERPPWLDRVSSTFGQVEQVRPDFLDEPL